MRAGQKGTLIVAIVVAVLVAAIVVAVVLPAAYSPTGSVNTAASSAAPGPAWETVATSVEGRPIEAFNLGSGPRRVLIVGGIHGDETGEEAARQLVVYLGEHPGAVPGGTHLTVVPAANPDGKAAGTRGNANSVDLNRNFPTSNWSGQLDEGDRPTAGLTGGASPGSEPETQALLGCLAEGCDLVISLHSSGGIIDYDGDEGLPVAQRISGISGLPVQHLDYQEHVTGSLGIYAPEKYGVPVITVELDGAALTAELRDALLAALD